MNLQVSASPAFRIVRCVADGGDDISLTIGQYYQALPDPAEQHGMVRVVDNTDEDYLFDAMLFEFASGRPSNPMSQPQIFAHRGARRAAPENTLPAFADALAMGVDGIELDVHVTTDGQLVVIHDFDVASTTDGRGLVSAMSAAEVRRLDAGSHFSPAFAGVRVPTLDEVFDLVGDRCQVNVEIKSLDPYARDGSDAVAMFVRRRNLHDQVLVSSFNPITLVKLRHLDPRIALGMLYDEEMPAFFRALWAGPPIHPEAQHPEHLLIDETYMAWARGLGCKVNTWTVNDVDEARRLAALGVNTIMTDVPDIILTGLRGET
jgi:glycerophosphoryl diester phosphodiesterase